MNTSSCHYCQKGVKREIPLVVFTCFAGFRKELSAEISNFDLKEGPIKPSESLNVIGHVENKKDAFQYHCFYALVFRDQHFLKRQAFLLTRLVAT